MLKIVIIEREPFTLLGIKTAISQSPDIEVSASATCGEIGLKLSELSRKAEGRGHSGEGINPSS